MRLPQYFAHRSDATGPNLSVMLGPRASIAYAEPVRLLEGERAALRITGAAERVRGHEPHPRLPWRSPRRAVGRALRTA
jgi:hypothetical protein